MSSTTAKTKRTRANSNSQKLAFGRLPTLVRQAVCHLAAPVDEHLAALVAATIAGPHTSPAAKARYSNILEGHPLPQSHSGAPPPARLAPAPLVQVAVLRVPTEQNLRRVVVLLGVLVEIPQHFREVVRHRVARFFATLGVLTAHRQV